ncbi:MAG: hypothetical protein HQM03_05900 [Magnetococcales bacterium]|nr:hypothetical protein [Magnetococcales bacterium]
MKSAATWGVVHTPRQRLWTRLTGRRPLTFACGQKVPPGGERGVVASLSALEMTVRKIRLPFTQREQLWELLPQEAQDTLLHRPDDPRFAMQFAADGQESDVLFAMCEGRLIDGLLASLAASGITPMGVVMAELGAWPLLEAANLIVPEIPTLVVDASLAPVALYTLVEGRVRDLRLVAPEVTEENGLLDEVDWLTGELIARLPNPQAGTIKVICLGASRAFWQPWCQAKGFVQSALPTSEALGAGLNGWEWLRSAGLALTATQGSHGRLLNFLDGGGEREWRSWWHPWRPAALLAAALLLTWSGQELLRYSQAKSRFEQTRSATETAFREALPHIPVMVDPVAQLKQALGQAGQREGHFPGMATWIGIIQNAVPAETQVKWLRLRHEPGEVQLTGEVPSYNHLDQVRAALKQATGGKETRMDEARILPETKQVHFRLGLL